MDTDNRRALFIFRMAGIAGLFLPLLLPSIPLVSYPVLPPAHSMMLPHWQQLLLFVAAFIIKPLYMGLSLVIAFLLRNLRSMELTTIRWGMICFFLGELACAMNYLIFSDNSPLFEYWHDFGMACAFALFASALMTVLDKRVIHYSDRDKPCAMLSLCGGCYKQGAMRCTLLTLFSWLLPPLAALAAIPLAAPVANRSVAAVVFSEQLLLGHTMVNQMVEARLFPVVALCFLVPAFILLLVRRECGFTSAGIMLSAGLGALMFSLMRFALYWGYAANLLWADVWEELTEFMFILVILKITLMVRSHQRRAHEISPVGQD